MRVLRVVKVALVHDQQGAFGFDEAEDPYEILAVPAIADEGDFQVRVSGDRARRALCVALWEREREKGRQHCAHNEAGDRKSTRLNSSHLVISYAAFCL